MKSITLGVILATSLVGCATSDSDSPTYEEFRDEAKQSFEGNDYYLVSGDIAVDEQQLRAIYDKNFGDGYATIDQLSIVNRVGNRDDKWTAARALNLRYCVTNSFGAQKARMVREMNQATAEWEAAARVNFIYVPAQDGNCVGSNANVTFAVRPHSGGGACAFFPSGGGCVARTLIINIADIDNNFPQTPNVKTVGVLRHELGHILGLRHEHTRPNTGVCFEDRAWRALTAYDRNSVMHYPWCNGNLQSSLAITASDAAGARALYGAP
jgi:Dual-action HEIGH metallo-peptidase